MLRHISHPLITHREFSYILAETDVCQIYGLFEEQSTDLG